MGHVEKGPRKEMYYFTDRGLLSAFRYEDWKLMFNIQEHHGFDVWMYPFTEGRVPLLINLRRDPFERAWHESIGYNKLFIGRVFVMVPAMSYIQQFLMTFKEYPQRQKVGTWTLDHVIDQLGAGSKGGSH